MKKFVLLIATLTFLTAACAASSEQTIYTFPVISGTNPHAFPSGPLLADGPGMFYGTTAYDGAFGFGTVYRLALTGGVWTKTVLYEFQGHKHKDGANPNGGLIGDPTGNLYGTTRLGGANACGGASGCGSIFRLSPNGSGGWTETVLFSLYAATGDYPLDGLVRDSSGALYGVASFGPGCPANSICGTAFQLKQNLKGVWFLKVLHAFTDTTDGSNPSGLVIDSSGNLFGVTVGGGASGVGSIYELTRNGSTWTETILHSFSYVGDGGYPMGQLTPDGVGGFYGTANSGGGPPNTGVGVVYQLTPTGGSWDLTVLHVFDGVSSDGINPASGVVPDGAGNLYGTTQYGISSSYGEVFKLTRGSGGAWTETTLYSFPRNTANPVSAYGRPAWNAAHTRLFGAALAVTLGSPPFGPDSIYRITP